MTRHTHLFFKFFFYEEISLHLLDKPNISKLTHSVKMDHVMGWQMKGFIPKCRTTIRTKKRSILKGTSFIQKSYYFSHNNPLTELCCIYFMEMPLFPHAVHFILEQSSSNISFYFYTFYILFLLYILSLMLCLKLCCQHLSSITWRETIKRRAYSIQDQCCIVSTLE